MIVQKILKLGSVGIRSYASQAEIELTSIRYKEVVKRGQFATLQDEDLRIFEGILGRERMVTDTSDLQIHNIDWIGTVRGASRLLLKPKTTDEVSRILKHCNHRRLAVVPQGGNTGLVGGSNPVFDEIIISSSLMNQILSLDEWSDMLVCQAGCVLETLDEYVKEKGLMMPFDLGAKGSCHIGGNASTNAGGLRLVRYGSLHSTILGVEAVLADGTIMDCMSGTKKDNTGYDLKHLFIGSEGTLGMVTKIGIQCVPYPKSISVAFLGLSSFENLLKTLRAAKGNLCEIVSALEYIDRAAMTTVTEKLGLRNPISEFPFYMLIECSGSNETHDQEKLNAFLEKMLETGVVADGTVAADITQRQAIWALRERIAEGMRHFGYVYKYDLSIPVVHFDELVIEVQKHLGPQIPALCTGYGHLGDGNIHLNVAIPEYDPKVTKLMEPFVYDWVRARSGSISAEHGLGFKKRNYITHSKSIEAVGMMQKLKCLFDPNGILNPYKVLPDQNLL